MSVLTRVRTVEERVSRTQLPWSKRLRPRVTLSSWPLPPTQLPGARLTWAKWVDLQASQLAREPYSEHSAHLEVSVTSR